MRKVLLVALVLITSIHALAQFAPTDTLRYRIRLKDKAATRYCLNHPEAFLSEKAITRRLKQHLSIDSTDLPVCKVYVDQIRKTGVHIMLTGKWDNFVTVSCNDSTLISEVTKLPFVRSTERVWKNSCVKKAVKRDSLIDYSQRKDDFYGLAARQIEISRGEKLHQAGFKGQGMTIAVIDAGFHNADRIEGMKKIQVLGVKDFVNPTADLFAESSHGLGVLSCMAMNQPHLMIGTAPEASYWLLRSEDEYSENLIEQDYWSAAVEFADSVGVDVINTSLGYYAFDDASKNYKFRDLDGQYALMSRQASKIADKGMILVCSAGNSGAGSWKKITPPGDAENVLTVGAVNKEGLLATFSSIGNTADGRIKPDVVAVGFMANVMGTNGCIRLANGTSFASPILCGMVACLWQACPQLTAKEVIEVVRRAGDRVVFPDNIYGYGLPDFWKAYTSVKEESK